MTVLGLRRRLVLRVLHHLYKGLLVVCLGEQVGASAQGDRALTEMLRGRSGTSYAEIKLGLLAQGDVVRYAKVCTRQTRCGIRLKWDFPLTRRTRW